METIKYVVLNKGNDPYDSIIGIKHTLNNIPKLLSHGIFQDFLKKEKEKLKMPSLFLQDQVLLNNFLY